MVGELEVDSLRQLAEELCLVRGRTMQQVERERLFVCVQSCFRSLDGKVARITSDFVLPGGVLLTSIGKLECPTLRDSLQELGNNKNPPMPLALYSNKKVLAFLNDYFCKKPPKGPRLFF